MNGAQRDELSALEAIYPDELKTINKQHHTYSIQLEQCGHSLTLYFEFHPDYPSRLPPRFQLESFRLDEVAKAELRNELLAKFEKETEVLFTWVEHVRDFLSHLPPILSKSPSQSAEESPKSKLDDTTIGIQELTLTGTSLDSPSPQVAVPELDIFHGELLTDRKSVFQAHLCRLSSLTEVEHMMSTLKANKKIAQATHNILAYRFLDRDKGVLMQDCDDDKEYAAGGRLLHLLQFSDAEGVAVVVSRWYGGIQLGPDRFKHISNVARTLLVDCDIIKGAEKGSKRKKK